jgi:hypothetical protein
VQRCLTPEYAEAPEPRTWQTSPGFRRVLDPLNAQRYAAACQEAEKLLPAYTDFDLIYVWHASALLYQKQLAQAEAVAQEGLARSKRKFNLCVQLGQIAWEAGNLADAVYWWAQAWHGQETLPRWGGNESTFLYLYYVAAELQLAGAAATLLRRVDQMRGGQIRLNATAASSLRSLARAGDTPDIQLVLRRLAEKYLGEGAPADAPASAAAAPAPAWAPGQVVETPGRLEIGLIAGLMWDEDRPRPPLGGAWVIPCLKVDAQRCKINMTLAKQANATQACVFETMPPGEYVIAYNPFPVPDEAGYRRHWDGKILDFSTAETLFASLTPGSERPVELFAGPRGGTVQSEAGPVTQIKANTAVGVRDSFPLIVEFLAEQVPYSITVKPAQTSQLTIRSHACVR